MADICPILQRGFAHLQNVVFIPCEHGGSGALSAFCPESAMLTNEAQGWGTYPHESV